MARIYAERVYDPKHSCDRRNNKQKLPLHGVKPEEAPLYAKTLAVTAEISIAHR